MKSSTFSRSLELAKLAAKVGLKELQSGDMKSRVEQALLIANSLSNLKGAAMKAGQLLSLDLNHYFPPEAIAILSQLQNAATAHPVEQIEKVLQQQISESERKGIKNISSVPIGVASIGQVHKAKYKGEDIVLKVQYPGVPDSIVADLKILKTLATSFCGLTGRKMNLEPLFAEFKNILEQEVDYQAEAQFQTQYQEHISELKTSKSIGYRVPRVIEGLSSGKVLAMSFESGVPLKVWMGAKPSISKRKDIAIAVLDLYFHEFFQWGLVQTDPNWGNFLVDEGKSKTELVLLDFGATRRYSREFIKNYIQLLNFAAKKDSLALRQHAIEIGMIDKRESQNAFQAFEEMLTTAIKPFFVGEAGSGLFDFSDKNHSLQSQTTAKALSDELIFSPPPYELIFLHRKLAGVYSILKNLEVQLDISSYWQQMTDLSALKAK